MVRQISARFISTFAFRDLGSTGAVVSVTCNADYWAEAEIEAIQVKWIVGWEGDPG
jgi:hypothetical protein